MRVFSSQVSIREAAGRAMQHVKDIREGVLDLVYPPFCVICGKPDARYICSECIDKVQYIEAPYCRTCGAPSETIRCVECRQREFAFESAHSAGVYECVLREAIHELKYSFHAALAEPLGDVMAERFSKTMLAGKVDVAVPVPIHRSRMLVRGFNQSEEITRRMCTRVSLPVEAGVLFQARKTRHQVDLPQDRRESNVKGAFAVHEPGKVRSKRVLLVDDVFTTGATLDEAASALLAAGAKSVHVYTLARSI